MLTQLPDPLPARLIADVDGIMCEAVTESGKPCSRRARVHDYEHPDGEPRHFCVQHAEKWLWWYLAADTPARKPAWAS